MEGARKLTEVEAREAVMSLLRTGRWAVYLSDDGTRLILRSRPTEIHTISDMEPLESAESVTVTK